MGQCRGLIGFYICTQLALGGQPTTPLRRSCTLLVNAAHQFELMAQYENLKQTDLDSDTREMYFVNLLIVLRAVDAQIPLTKSESEILLNFRAHILSNISHSDADVPNHLFQFLKIFAQSPSEQVRVFEYLLDRYIRAESHLLGSTSSDRHLRDLTILATSLARVANLSSIGPVAQRTLLKVHQAMEFPELEPIRKQLGAKNAVENWLMRMPPLYQDHPPPEGLYPVKKAFITDPYNPTPAYTNQRAINTKAQPISIRAGAPVTIEKFFLIDPPNGKTVAEAADVFFYEVSVLMSDVVRLPGSTDHPVLGSDLQSEVFGPEAGPLVIKVIVPMKVLVKHPLHTQN